MKKSVHFLYLTLLAMSVAVVLLSLHISSMSWNAIIMSVGCGGTASVMVAWLIDVQNHRNIRAENEKRFEAILRQYVKLYRRLVWTIINECYGLYKDSEERSLEEWLMLLSNEKAYPNAPACYSTMQRRCERVSGNIVALQKYIENFQIQSATLILNDFPGIEDILAFFEVQHIHAWGTLEQLESGNYMHFCGTTYVLYKEFLEKFPQYQTEFSERYSATILKEWKI